MISKGRWSNFLFAIAGGVVGAMVAGAGVPGRLWQTGAAEAAMRRHVRTVTADNFVLVDRRGLKRAELHMVSGEPVLVFYGPDGKTGRASVGVNMRGVARARFYSSTGMPQAAIGVTGDGKAGVALLDRQQHLRATMDVAIGGEPTLRLYDEKGPRLGLDVTEAGSPGLALLDSASKTRAALALGTDGSPALTFYDAGGNVLAGLPQ